MWWRGRVSHRGSQPGPPGGVNYLHGYLYQRCGR